MKWLKKYLLLPRSKQITIFVWAVHFLAIFAMTSHHWIASFFTKKPRPIAVRTFQAKPPPKVIAQTSPPKKNKPKPSPKPKNPAPAPKPAPPKKNTPPAAKPLVQATAPIEEENFDALLQKLDNIATPEKAVRRPLSVPSKIEQVSYSIEEKSSDPAYGDFLITYLQEMLDLPEFGEVKARLNIDRFGNLVGCEILNAKSKKNAEALKKRLSELSFPCFNDFGLDDASLFFTVTFRNVETP